MLPFGKLAGIQGTRAQVVGGWVAGFERAGCEVSREAGGRLVVSLPSWEERFVAPGFADDFQELSRDRMIVEVDVHGCARFRLAYFSLPQVFLHLAITALFAFEAYFPASGRPEKPVLFIGALLAAHAAVFLVSLAGFGLSRVSALRKALDF